jgi:hypothetical protein
MNIFYLDKDIKKCAEMHVDKHVVKMILEYAQLLSTAHRVLDGTISVGLSSTGRKKTSYILEDYRDSILYSATHINHPSAIWVRQSEANYRTLFNLFCELLEEYTYRYEKTHACTRLMVALSQSPKNIKLGDFTQPTPAMPDEYKVKNDSIKSYRNYYIHDKNRFAKWKNRSVPDWFAQGVLDANI